MGRGRRGRSHTRCPDPTAAVFFSRNCGARLSSTPLRPRVCWFPFVAPSISLDVASSALILLDATHAARTAHFLCVFFFSAAAARLIREA